MDATWGIVIVSVVGVAGTVLGTYLQNRHNAKMAREQRESDARAALRERLSLAFTVYLKEIDSMESYLKGERPQDDQDSLLSQLARAELDLAVTGTEEVAGPRGS